MLNKKNFRINPLISVFEDTIFRCKKARFRLQPSVKYSFLSEDFSDQKLLAAKMTVVQSPVVIIENIDSFDMARKMDSKVMVLNLASHIKPGGGVINGAKAQEECLFRESNYHEVVDERMYPLKMEEVVYSPLVHIIKDSSYNLLQYPIPVACLAVAAIRNPKLVLGTDGTKIYANKYDEEVMQEKINTVFKIAIKHGHDELVLGALGCGVFGNPPKQVAIMFKNAIQKYGCYFKRIGFAIFSKNDDENFKVFTSVLT